MSNSNVIYTNIRYNNYYDNDNDNDMDITLNNYDNDNDNDNIETTTMYYLIDYINRNR